MSYTLNEPSHESVRAHRQDTLASFVGGHAGSLDHNSHASPIPEQSSPYDADYDSPDVNPPYAMGQRPFLPQQNAPRGEDRGFSGVLPPGDPAGDPSQLPFASLRISDPTPAASISYQRPVDSRRDPIARSVSAAPSAAPSHRLPQHANTLLPPQQYPSQMPGSSNTLLRTRNYSLQSYQADHHDNYSPSSVGHSPQSPPSVNGSVNGGFYRDHHQQPQSGYNAPYRAPPPPSFDPLYAAASDVLGLPPGAAPPPSPHATLPVYQHSLPNRSPSPAPSTYAQQPPPPPQPTNQYLQPGSSDPHRLSGDPYGAGPPPANPGLNRSDTVMPRNGRPAMKAVDVNQPPYTKEYIDQYRNRLKGDPDPETHFAFAKYLIDAAKKVGANAQDQKAVRRYRDQLIAESVKVLRRLATTGETYPEAQFFLANCYGTGLLNLEVDHEKAYHLYLQASKQNHAQACYRVAVCNLIGAGTRRDTSRAFAFYRKAASLGDTAAMYKLGMILLTGDLGQNKNPRDAIPWLRRAAEQADEDNPHALHELGLLYERQQGASGFIIHDPNYAKELFTQAANLGYTQSQFKLGHCYEYGTLGCPIDPKRSLAWYIKAAGKEDPHAELALSGWYLTGSDGILKQSDSEAYLWARRAANKGLADAEYAVGYYTEQEIGVKADLEIAKRWYMRAAAQGNSRAMARLTELKRNGGRGGKHARPTRQQAKDEGCIII